MSTSNSPMVSVLIPVFNGADLVGRAIQSALDQTFRDIEIVVLDDGSTDETCEVVQKYPVRLISQSNRGIGFSRQRLVEEARGEWIAFLDHDDWWSDEKLERQVPWTCAENIGLVYTWATFLDEHGGREEAPVARAPKSSLDHVLPDCLVNNCSTLARRQAILDCGGFPDTSCAEDWLMWLRLVAKWDIACVDERLTWTFRRRGSASTPNARWYEGEQRILEEAILPRFDTLYARFSKEDRERVRTRLRRKLAALASLHASALDREGRLRDARRRHVEALMLAPTMKGAWLRAAQHVIASSRARQLAP